MHNPLPAEGVKQINTNCSHQKLEAVRQSRLFVTIFFKSTVEKNM
jgi:hypothetical protein